MTLIFSLTLTLTLTEIVRKLCQKCRVQNLICFYFLYGSGDRYADDLDHHSSNHREYYRDNRDSLPRQRETNGFRDQHDKDFDSHSRHHREQYRDNREDRLPRHRDSNDRRRRHFDGTRGGGQDATVPISEHHSSHVCLLATCREFDLILCTPPPIFREHHVTRRAINRQGRGQDLSSKP
jgi:hypothetical protein